MDFSGVHLLSSITVFKVQSAVWSLVACWPSPLVTVWWLGGVGGRAVLALIYVLW